MTARMSQPDTLRNPLPCRELRPTKPRPTSTFRQDNVCNLKESRGGRQKSRRRCYTFQRDRHCKPTTMQLLYKCRQGTQHIQIRSVNDILPGMVYTNSRKNMMFQSYKKQSKILSSRWTSRETRQTSQGRLGTSRRNI